MDEKKHSQCGKVQTGGRAVIQNKRYATGDIVDFNSATRRHF